MIKAIQGTQPAFYDDEDFNYLTYWSGRDYEHESEVIAIRRLLRGQRFSHAADVGGGYGRLSVVLRDYADKVTLVDASSQQLDLAADFLAGHPGVEKQLMDASSLTFPDGSLDLVAMVRVLHHLPDPAAELGELRRVLRPGGTAIIEVANVAHAVNRVRHLVRRERLPLTALDIRSPRSRERDGIPFVNHHPATIIGQFQAAGLNVVRVLSVSNLRHPAFKKVLPGRAILVAERTAQVGLARVRFGPSLFFLLRTGPAAQVPPPRDGEPEGTASGSPRRASP